MNTLHTFFRRGLGGLGVLALCAGLAACGGGGSGTATSSSGASSTTPTTTTSTTTTSTTPLGTPTVANTTPSTSSTTSTTSVDPGTAVLSGVASIGSPLLGANLRIVDGNGARVSLVDGAGNKVSSLRTSTADGSYRIVLATATPTLPLLIQAAGVDSAGTPLVLHTMLNTSTLPMIANITPVTDAVVAQVLGANPQTLFANAASAWPTLSLLGSTTAVTSASDQIKAVIKTNLTDAKITSTTTLDFFRDDTFRANKTLMDAAVEGLRTQIVKDSTGKDQLQISNKFLAPGTVEVRIDLTSARTELLNGSSGSVSKAIVSTLKATTSPNKTSLANLATLDVLGESINKMIAQGANAAGFLGSVPLAAAYQYQDGRSRAATADLLASYASQNSQLGRFQVMGCLNDPIPTAGCTRFQVSALVVDRLGQVVEPFTETVGYSTSTTPNWTLIGNGRLSDVKAYPVAQVTLSPDGTLPAGAPGASNGIQILARAQDRAVPPNKLLQSVTVQVPSGYSAQMLYCGVNEMCMTTNAAVQPTATGDLNDSLLQKPTPGWVGSQDAVRGAKFTASVSLVGTPTETLSLYLPADVPNDLSLAQFPKPDAPVTPDAVANGTTLAWRAWQEQNPNLRVFSVRLVTRDGAGAIAVQDFPVNNPFANAVILPLAPTAPTAYSVWLGAMDNQGRRFFSKLQSAP